MSGTDRRTSVARHFAAFLSWCLFALSGCGGRSDDGSIELQLNWIPDAQHGGFYAADVLGFYREAGLNVRITPGGPSTPVIPKVAMGKSAFGIANADQVLLAREQEADLVAIFAAMQNSPRCIMVHEKSGIRSLDELQDLTLALGEGKTFAEFLKRHVPLRGVRVVAYSGTVAKFLIDEDYAQQAYVFSEPIVAAARGGDPYCLMLSDLGFNPYSSLVITDRRFLESHRDVVQRFVEATRQGWQAYLQDPTTANEAILRDNPEMDARILAESAKAIRQLCLPNGMTSEQLGTMTVQRWTKLHQQLAELKLVSDVQPPEKAFLDLFHRVDSPEE